MSVLRWNISQKLRLRVAAKHDSVGLGLSSERIAPDFQERDKCALSSHVHLELNLVRNLGVPLLRREEASLDMKRRNPLLS